MPQTKPSKCFTVSLNSGNYGTLHTFVEAHHLPLLLQYVIRLAVRRFLDQHEDSILDLKPMEANRYD